VPTKPGSPTASPCLPSQRLFRGPRPRVNLRRCGQASDQAYAARLNALRRSESACGSVMYRVSPANLTYEALGARVAALARRLQAVGVGPETVRHALETPEFRLLTDIVAKVFLGWRTKILRPVGAAIEQ
jgi:hypothetical protein